MSLNYADSGKTVSGFTLLELIVVLFIISVAMAVVLPSFFTTGSTLKADAGRLASVLRHLNETSAVKKKTLRLQFDLDQKSIRWPDGEGSRSASISNMRAVELQTTGIVKTGEITVYFAPTGIKQYLWVYLEDEDRELTVVLNPVSGRVKILEQQ